MSETGPAQATDGGAPVSSGPWVEFVDERARLSQLVFWNTLASFLTLGLYRFWARTRLRRHFWHRVLVAGAPAEYLGRGIELLLGFIIVFGFLGLVFFVFSFAGLFAFAEEANTDIISLVPFLIIPVFLPAALFRARRYRLGRTIWRGIRLGQDGSTWRYMMIWLGGAALTILTLGLAYPWRNVWTEHYRLRHTLVGDHRVSFDARGWGLLLAWLLPWLSAVLFGGAVATGLVWWSLYARVSESQLDVNVQQALHPPWSDFYAIPPALWGLLILVTGMIFIAAFLTYRVAEFRYFVSRVGLGKARMTSDLQTAPVLSVTLPYALGLIGYVILSLLTVGIIVQMLRDLPAQLSAGPESLFLALGLITISLGLLFAASYGMSLLFNFNMRSRLIGLVSRSLTIHNIDALDDIGQAAIATPGRGEGLADLFDLGDF